MGYSLRVNHKQLSLIQHSDRNLQFQMIGVLHALYSLHGYLIISVDALRRIIVGMFWNKGASWRKKAIKVFDHDYPSWGSVKGPSMSDFRTTRLSLPLTASQDGGRPLDAIGIPMQKNCLFLPTVEEAMAIARVHGSTFYSISCQLPLD